MNRTLLPLAVLLWLVAACAAWADAPAEADEELINELYAAIDISVWNYQKGIERIRAGETAAGRQHIRRAVGDLGAAGDACAQLPGCEVQRFMAAYHNLLTLRSDVLAGAAEDYVEIEPAEQDEAAHPPLHAPGGPVIQLLNGQNLAQVIERNALVRAALHDWLTWMRPTLIDAYENYTHMRHLMWPAYEEADLPEALLFGILAKESGGRVHSVSRAGAAGPLQFMHHTGLRFGLTQQDGFDLRFDPAAATRANAAYLRERFAQLDGNLELALAAYNGGEGRIQRLIRGNSDPRFWNPEIFGQLPRETQEYVPYVLAAAWLFLHPEDYGLEFPKPDTAPATVQLETDLTLSELSICLGQQGSRAGWFRTLRNLNPRHEHDQRLPVGTRIELPAVLLDAHQEHCLQGPRLALARDLHASRDERRELLAMRIYTVRSGDTLSTIASEQGCPSARAIARENDIAGPRYLIRPGQQLTLIGCRS